MNERKAGRTVGEIMTRDPIVVRADAPLAEVARLLDRHHISGLPVVDGGTVFLQSPLTDPEGIWTSLPARARAEILARRIRLTALDTASLAAAHAPRPDLVVRMQGVALVGVFLRIAPFAERAGLDRAGVLEAVRTHLGRYFGKRGGAVVDANMAVIEQAYDGVIDVTAAIAGLGPSGGEATRATGAQPEGSAPVPMEAAR